MSQSTRRDDRRKPSKPSRNYPLFAHSNGQWAKKIRGRLFYFGTWDDPQGALDHYRRVADDLHAGRQPRAGRDGLTLRDLCNHFLTDRKHRLNSGEIVLRTWQEYYDTCERVLTAFGSDRLVDDLRPDDFGAYRAKYAKGRAPATISTEVQRVRTIFNYALQADLVDRPVKVGPTFKRPSKRIMRKAKRKNGPRMFEAEDIRKLLKAAPLQLRAMTLLGANCGFGNADCGRLPMAALDLELGWVNFPRPKTETDRRCPLWAETVSALHEVLGTRPEPKLSEHAGLVFITKYHSPWFKATRDNPITKEFRKLLDEYGLHRPGLGFYALRHTFETIAGGSRDQVAVDHIMGHARDDMASIYRERIEDDRLVAVVQHVHGWLFGVEGGEQ